MNNRIELLMHRWSPRVALGGMILAGLTVLVLQLINDHRPEPVAYWRTIDGMFFVVGFALYWFALPLWVVIDARRRQEKAVVWGLFTLLGNVVALVLYLLVRRDPQAGKEFTGLQG